jgi:LacI family transcriptional regulator
VYLIQALHLHKLKMPEDIAVVGFDDFELAEVLGTPLTVVRQSPTGIARAAAELLFKKIANLREGTCAEEQTAKMLFPTELIIFAGHAVARRENRCHLSRGEHIIGSGRFIFL